MQKFITLIIFFALQCSFAQSASEYNSGATNAYKAGNYAQAKEYFELALEKQDNAITNYNLANTCEKLGEIGAAKAYYMRAIYQNPRLKEAIFNLEALEKKYALSNFNHSNADKFFDELSLNEWLIIASVFLWLSIACFVVLPLLKIRKPWQFFLGLITFSVFVLSAFALHYWYSFANTAIALKDNAPLRISPANSSEISSTLKQGQMLSLGAKKGNFHLANNQSQKGWVSIDNKDFMQVKK